MCEIVMHFDQLFEYNIASARGIYLKLATIKIRFSSLIISYKQ